MRTHVRGSGTANAKASAAGRGRRAVILRPTRVEGRAESETITVRAAGDGGGAEVKNETEAETESSEVDVPSQEVGGDGDAGSSKGAAEAEGAPFNQFDPAATLSRAITRRFGFAGGLAFVAFLAATDGVEIVEALLRPGEETVGSGETVTLESGVQYMDDVIVNGGNAPSVDDGLLVGLNMKVTTDDGEVLLDTKAKGNKAVAFTYGRGSPLAPLCSGVWQAISGLKPGAKRRIVVPPNAAFGESGVTFPNGSFVKPDTTLTYAIEVLTVSPGWNY